MTNAKTTHMVFSDYFIHCQTHGDPAPDSDTVRRRVTILSHGSRCYCTCYQTYLISPFSLPNPR
jgi:hypothetical protein